MDSKVTKEMFLKYRKAQSSGLFNMFMDGKKVMALIGCPDPDVYTDIMFNYKTHMKNFGIKA